MTFALLVNGVPASGKSALARALADRTGWAAFGLDTVKEALFAHLGTGDREHNRLFGRASYQAIFAAIGDFPATSAVIVDAWFGFQPEQVLRAHLARARVADAAQVWCHAPPEVVRDRYLARVGTRPAGHLGADYAPELEALARRAKPFDGFPTLTVDATAPFDVERIAAWAEGVRRATPP